MVNKEGYDNCNSGGGLKILICDKPTELKYKYISISDFAGHIDIPIFHEGRTNYFIGEFYFSFFININICLVDL